MSDAKNELSELEKQQLLGMDLGDLEDLPEFVTAPAGTYLCSLEKKELKKVGENPAVTANFKIMDIVELAKPDEAGEVKIGDIMGLMFTLNNEFGRGNLKKITKVLKDTHGVNSLDDFLKLQDGAVVCTVTVKRTAQEKNGETKHYNNLVTFLTA
jgi:hypothetical protein